jgi:flagellar basal body rod protein FlgC
MIHMGVTGIALGGLQTAEIMLEKSANRTAQAVTPESDPVTDVVELMSAKEQFRANARVIQVGDQMRKNLIDMLG